jgi:hypothetical protein
MKTRICRFHTLGTASTIARDITDQTQLLVTLESTGSVVTHLSTMGTTIVKGA